MKKFLLPVLLAACGGVEVVGLDESALSTLQYPNGDGAISQFTTSTGTVHYVLVDETVCNQFTDYNYAKTVNETDDYTVSLASIPNTYHISQITVTGCMRKKEGVVGDGTNATADITYRWNGSSSSPIGTGAIDDWTSATGDFTGLSLVKGASSTLELGFKYTGCSGAFCTLRKLALSAAKVNIVYAP